MFKPFAMIFASIFWALHGSGQAGEVSREIAAGEWSQPVSDQRGYALRGRLVLCEKPSHPDGLREVVVYVELQDCSDFIGNTMRLYCEMGPHDFRPESTGGLKCKLSKVDKIPIEPTGFPFGGATPKSEWVTLPVDGTIRVRATPFGIRRAKAIAICPHLGGEWVIADNDPLEYFLSGTFTITPAKGDPQNESPPSNDHDWQGTLELPAAVIRNTGP